MTESQNPNLPNNAPTSPQDSMTNAQEPQATPIDTATSAQESVTSAQDTSTVPQDSAASVQESVTAPQESVIMPQNTATMPQELQTSAQELQTMPQEASAVAQDSATSASIGDTTPMSDVEVLLPAPVVEPPRALVPGAFLKLQYEIKQVLARGLTNLYLAETGDYGAAEYKLIAERATPTVATAPTSIAPAPIEVETTAPVESAAVETMPAVGQSIFGDDIELTSGALQAEAQIEAVTEPSAPPLMVPLEETAPMSVAALGESPAELSDAPSAVDESAPAIIEAPQSNLFPEREAFAQDGRDYLVFDYFASRSLQDYREPTNDARYLLLLKAICDGMAELESRGESADFSRDLLRFDADGQPFYVGFADAIGVQAVPDAITQLREINSFLLKRVLAESSTMRLDDQFGSLALSEEVKDLAERLDEGALSLADVRGEIARLGGGKAPKVEAALLSDVGQEREVNEDSGMIARLHRAAHLNSYQYDLYVVADGMGGHEGGEVASDLTIAALQRALGAHSDLDWNDNVAVKAMMLDVIGDVNDEVVALTQTPKYMAMRAKPGSTLTFAIRLGARVFVGNVGDSRTYKWNARDGLTRISKDHSYVQTLIDSGQLSEEDSWDHPDGSIITAHIGDAKGKTRDVFLRLMAPGDKLLLVSDGVVDMLRDHEIAPYLKDEDPHRIVKNLVDASNAAGGLDNITALCVKFE